MIVCQKSRRCNLTVKHCKRNHRTQKEHLTRARKKAGRKSKKDELYSFLIGEFKCGKWVRAIQGEKDDNKDAKWISDLFRLGMVRGSYIPSKEIRILREFTRYKYKLTGLRSGEMNRYHNCLTVGNLAVDHVFSDIFGKGSQAIIDYILSTCDEEFDDDYCLSLLPNKGKRKSSNEEILNAVKNSHFTTAQKTRISVVKEHLDYILILSQN